MAYKIVNSDYAPVTGQNYAEFILDDNSDINQVPTNCAPGSLAIVAAKSGKVYMLNASHVWKEL